MGNFKINIRGIRKWLRIDRENWSSVSIFGSARTNQNKYYLLAEKSLK